METTKMVPVSSETIRNRIEAMGLKRWWVAENIGVHRTTLQRWTNGKIARGHSDALDRLADLLGLSPAEVCQL